MLVLIEVYLVGPSPVPDLVDGHNCIIEGQVSDCELLVPKDDAVEAPVEY